MILMASVGLSACLPDSEEEGSSANTLRTPSLDTVEVTRVEDGFSEFSEAIGLGLPVQVVTSAATTEGPGPAVVVLDGGGPAVRVLDEAGAEVTSLGGGGEGPGEFTRLGRVQVDSSAIWVFDPGSSRLTSWSWQGQLLSERTIHNPQTGLGSFAMLEGHGPIVPASIHDDRLMLLVDSLEGGGGLPALRREERGESPVSSDHVSALGRSAVALENATAQLWHIVVEGSGYSAKGFRLPEEVTRPLDDILDRMREDLAPAGITTQYVRDMQVASHDRVLLTFMRPLPGAIVGADLDLASERMTLIRLRPDREIVDDEYVRRTRSIAPLHDCYLLANPRGVERHCPSDR